MTALPPLLVNGVPPDEALTAARQKLVSLQGKMSQIWERAEKLHKQFESLEPAEAKLIQEVADLERLCSRQSVRDFLNA